MRAKRGSRRTGAAAGSRQGRNTSAALWKGSQRQKRGEEEARATIHAIGDERRGTVYRADAVYAPEDKPTPPPRRGTPERAALVAKVAAMKAAGMTHLAIEVELNLSGVAVLLREAANQ